MRRPPTMIEELGSIELTSGATSMLITPSASTVGVKARLTPKGLNSTVIAVLTRRRSHSAALRDRDRKLAAGKEAGSLAGQRDQCRLGQRSDCALGFERIERRLNVEPENVEVRGSGCRTRR